MTTRKCLTAFTVTLLAAVVFTPSASAQAPDPLCLVTLLDQSGSLPQNNFSVPILNATKILLSGLGPDDRMAVVSFARDAAQLTPGLMTLGPLVERHPLFKALGYPKAKGYADLRRAFREAEGLLQGAGCRRAAIVLFSEGRIARRHEAGPEYEQEIFAILQRLNVPVLAVALGEQPDLAFLELLTSVHPVSRLWLAPLPEAVTDAALSLLADLKPITFQGEDFQPASGTFGVRLDPERVGQVAAITFLLVGVAPASVTLTYNGQPVPPSEEVSDAWISVQQVNRPAPGEWRLIWRGRDPVQARVLAQPHPPQPEAAAPTLSPTAPLPHQPAVSFSVPSLNLGRIQASDLANGLRLDIPLHSTSPQIEWVSFHWLDPPGIGIYPASDHSVWPGESSVVLLMRGRLPPGPYRAHVNLTLPEGQVASQIEIRFEVAAVLPDTGGRSNAVPLMRIFGGGGLLVFGLLVTLGLLYTRPRVWGALRVIRRPREIPLPPEILLRGRGSFLKPGEVILGSLDSCGITLREGGIKTRHARIYAAKSEGIEVQAGGSTTFQTVRVPALFIQNLGQGRVRVNGALLTRGQTARLYHGCRLELGDYHFYWIAQP